MLRLKGCKQFTVADDEGTGNKWTYISRNLKPTDMHLNHKSFFRFYCIAAFLLICWILFGRKGRKEADEIFMRFFLGMPVGEFLLPLMFRYERSHFELNLLVADVNLQKPVMMEKMGLIFLRMAVAKQTFAPAFFVLDDRQSSHEERGECQTRNFSSYYKFSKEQREWSGEKSLNEISNILQPDFCPLLLS